ncbi:MAG: 50S ribosomal protein L9 [Campylobacterales bacterium]
MKVLLTKDVKGLGKAGDIKEVKDGYGQNFIIAKGFGQLATTEVIRKWEAKQRALKEQEVAELARLQELKTKLDALTLTITKQVGANGALFGAITKEDIAETLKAQGYEVDKKSLEIKQAIKATGHYEIDCKLGHGIHATLKLNVEAL